MRLFNQLSLMKKVLTIVALACMICTITAVSVSRYYKEKTLHTGLIEKSRTIHSRLLAATDFVAEQGGLNPIIERYVQKYRTASEMTAEDKTAVLKQVPIYSAMRIGSKGAEDEHYKFRIFSDEPRRKENMATPDELDVFNQFKNNPGLSEIVSDTSKIVTVYKPIRLQEKQGCLTCHGSPSTSPWHDGHDILGFKMENWQDGKLHGVFAIISNVQEIKAVQAKSEIISTDNLLGIYILLGGLLAIFLAALLLKGPIEQLRKITTSLGGTSTEVSSTSQTLASSSEELAQSTTEQAAAIEETAASIEEMSAMVTRNSESANNAASTSEESRDSAEQGRKVVEKMIQSMDEINQSNSVIMEQVNQSNAQMGDIVKVIQDIGNKTKVINDIVFQTKLLSFNASVEAARAGEHGKGFAVVAEEVGNLAQMSGNAAKEISEMLQESIQKVEKLAQETKSKVERLAQDGRAKVSEGTEVAKQCGEVLSGIVTRVSNVSMMANEISSASKEQAQGVQEITKAMSQLDQVTQNNSAASEQTAKSAESLSNQAHMLKDVVNQLLLTVDGVGNQTQSKTPPQSAKILPFKKQEKHIDEKKTPKRSISRVDVIPSQDDPGFGDV